MHGTTVKINCNTSVIGHKNGTVVIPQSRKLPGSTADPAVTICTSPRIHTKEKFLNTGEVKSCSGLWRIRENLLAQGRQ